MSSAIVLESDLKRELFRVLEEEPETSRQVALAKAGVSETQLSRWKREDKAFLLRWNAISRARDLAPRRMPAPRVASRAVVHRVLAAVEEDPERSLQEHCRVAGTTAAKVEAACSADPRLGDLYRRAIDAVVAPVATVQLKSLRDPRNTSAREKFLARNGGGMWGGEPTTTQTVHVHGDVNMAVLNAAPKAKRLDDGRFQPRDMPLSRLVAGDVLPSMTGGKEQEVELQDG